MYISEILIENFRCFGSGTEKLVMPLKKGLTAMVGENDAGKTAVIDALRLALGTKDQEYLRVEDSDFHWPGGSAPRSKDIRVRLRFDGLDGREKGSFAEFLSYELVGTKREATFYLNWLVKDGTGVRSDRRFVQSEFKSGKDADGPPLDYEARELLRVTYLRPLRDAERALSAGRSSRLAQILQHTKEVLETGDDYDPSAATPLDPTTLSVLGVGDWANALLKDRDGIKEAKKRLNNHYLKPLSFSGDPLSGDITIVHSGDKEMRLRQLLERMDLSLIDDHAPNVPSNRGLGSNNLLFMACELLLLGSEHETLPLLLIEEPEAHLHPQRQLRLMQFLQEQVEKPRDDEQKIQVLVTTHSPVLASAIKLDNMVMIQGARAFSLTKDRTKLEADDYRFLERFLDSTKANLLFARGVVIVEGDGENILLPTLASLIGRDFREHGVSIVNVGGTGLRRFAKIFQRKDEAADGRIDVSVACIADLDIMPDCAPAIVGKVKAGEAWPELKERQWRARSDFPGAKLKEKKQQILKKADGQNVTTFVADDWTFEYDLAKAGLDKDVWIAGCLAKAEESLETGKKSKKDVEEVAEKAFKVLADKYKDRDDLCSHVYSIFTKGTKASKAITAQYLAERLTQKVASKALTSDELEGLLPAYIVSAIKHVTGSPTSATAATDDEESEAAKPEPAA